MALAAVVSILTSVKWISGSPAVRFRELWTCGFVYPSLGGFTFDGRFSSCPSPENRTGFQGRDVTKPGAIQPS